MAASSGGEANELIDEVAGSAVNEMGNAMAAMSGGGEASEAIDEATQGRRQRGGRKKKSGHQKGHERRERRREER